jgi:nucleoside-triphosphatase
MTIIVLTGPPGIGKTTAVLQIARVLKDRGINVGGIVSREIRVNNERVGFEFIDLITNDTNVLASISGKGPKVGKYFVSFEGCHFAAERLDHAMKSCNIIICDEIGPMEVKSREFLESVKNLLNVDKKVIVVIHQKLRYPIIDQIRMKSELIINLNLQNREKINEILLHKLRVE